MSRGFYLTVNESLQLGEVRNFRWCEHVYIRRLCRGVRVSTGQLLRACLDLFCWRTMPGGIHLQRSGGTSSCLPDRGNLVSSFIGRTQFVCCGLVWHCFWCGVLQHIYVCRSVHWSCRELLSSGEHKC